MPNPVDGVVTSSFGKRVSPLSQADELHNGIDIAVPIGTGVCAIDDGEVIEVRESASYGRTIKYRTISGYEVLYAHLDSICVSMGDTIKKGQIIAKSGNTGRSTGPHLHYSVWRGSVLLDPMQLVKLSVTDEVRKEYAQRGEALD